MRAYIHFSTSAILPLLQRSHFSLCSLDTMLYHYGYAPMSGEISGGGVIGTGNDVGTAFSITTFEERIKWNIPHLYKNYGGIQWQTTLKMESDLENSIDRLLKSGGLGNIRPFLINLLRHKQMGVLPPLSEKNKQRIFLYVEKNAKEIMRQYAANYIVAKYFKIAPGLSPREVSCHRFTCDLENHVPENFLFLSEQEQRSIVKKLALPEGLVMDELPKIEEGTLQLSEQLEYSLSLVKRFPGNIDFMTNILKNKDISREILPIEKIKNELMASCERLFNVQKAFKNLFRSNEDFFFSAKEKGLIKNSFPIAFILTSNSRLESVREEYRATEALALGRDIKTVATDEQHAASLQRFFSQAGLMNIRVITMDQLKRGDINPNVTWCDFFHENKTILASVAGATAIATGLAYLNKS